MYLFYLSSLTRSGHVCWLVSLFPLLGECRTHPGMMCSDGPLFAFSLFTPTIINQLGRHQTYYSHYVMSLTRS